MRLNYQVSISIFISRISNSRNKCINLSFEVRQPTEGVFGSDGWVLSRWTDTKLVLSKCSEDVVLELDQAHSFVCGLFDGGGQSVPDFAVGGTALHNVVGHFGAAIVTWRIPGQEAGLVGDLRNVKGSRRTRLI